MYLHLHLCLDFGYFGDRIKQVKLVSDCSCIVLCVIVGVEVIECEI